MIFASIFAQAEDEGAELYKELCGSCHELPDTQSSTAEMWIDIVEEMAPVTEFSGEEEKAVVLRYLQANAGTREHVLEVEGRYFDRLCSSCHDRSSIPATGKQGRKLTSFLIDHLIEEADQDIDESDAHEVAEFMLHSSLWKQD